MAQTCGELESQHGNPQLKVHEPRLLQWLELADRYKMGSLENEQLWNEMGQLAHEVILLDDQMVPLVSIKGGKRGGDMGLQMIMACLWRL